MRRSGDQNEARGGITSGVLLASAVSLLALPSAVLAFSSRFEPRVSSVAASQVPDKGIGSVPGASLLAQAPAMRSLSSHQPYPFTPAGSANRPGRSVTVAVRVDPQTARIISVRGRKIEQVSESSEPALAIAPNAFQLGISRGYQNFGKSIVSAPEVRDIEMPDLSSYRVQSSGGSDTSRFSPRIVIDEKQAAGRAPRTFAGDREDRVDVGGSYRVTRNLDVTAGVRYSQDRDRLKPLTDGKQDSQAVYVGTQFRF